MKKFVEWSVVAILAALASFGVPKILDAISNAEIVAIHYVGAADGRETDATITAAKEILNNKEVANRLNYSSFRPQIDVLVISNTSESKLIKAEILYDDSYISYIVREGGRIDTKTLIQPNNDKDFTIENIEIGEKITAYSIVPYHTKYPSVIVDGKKIRVFKKYYMEDDINIFTLLVMSHPIYSILIFVIFIFGLAQIGRIVFGEELKTSKS